MANFEYKFFELLDESLKETLTNQYSVDELDVEDVYTNTQLSKVEQHSNYMYVALQFPEYNQSSRHFLTKEVHCFVSEKYLLVIDKHKFKHVGQFQEVVEAVMVEEEKSFYVFYEMVDFIITKIFRVMSKFRDEITDMENRLFSDRGSHLVKKDLITDLEKVKRNLIDFVSIISPLESTIVELQTKHNKFVDNEGVEWLDDSLDKIKKMLNNLINFRQQVDMIIETNEALIARNTNDTIKILTAVNLAVVMPTMITSFFGMNVYFGLDVNNPTFIPLIIIILTAIVSVVGIFVYFKKKKWL